MPALVTSALIGGGASLLGGLFGGSSARSAARTQADAQVRAAQIAAEEARFRPVGVTTRFGQSQFQTDPKTGRVTGASYTLDPELRAMQDRYLRLAGGGLTQAEQAQEQYAPLQGAAGGLFNLGQQYIAESPEQAAEKYILGRQKLLAPSRERQYAQLQTGLFNTGRSGLAVGGTGLRPGGGEGLRAANPEMEAYYNAIAQQDAQLASEAMQAGMDQTRFGAGLFATGGNLLTQGYGGQEAALGPYEAYLQQMKQLESLGQQPLQLGIDIGAKGQSNAAAQIMYEGNKPSRESYAANAYNPYADFLTGASRNPALRNVSGGGVQAGFSQTSLGGSGYGTGLAYGNQDIGAFI